MTPEQLIDGFTVSGLIASIVSICLACFAVWQAWQFYLQAKASEVETKKALIEIKAQTETLQKLTANQIKSLTKAVTEQSPTEKFLVEALANISTSQLKNTLNSINTPADEADSEALRKEVVLSYIGLHHYTAMANNILVVAAGMPDIKDEAKAGILHYIDYSYADFQYMEQIMSNLSQDEIQSSKLGHMYTETENKWKQHIRSVAQLEASAVSEVSA